MKIIAVLDHGYVALEESMGGDLAAVNAAEISYARQSLTFTEAGERLLKKLMGWGHGSPYEHQVMRFRVKAPLFVIAQWKRHRIASWNQRSMRYTEADPEFYAPDPSYEAEARQAYEHYLERVASGEPKEKARINLPESLYTEFIWTINSRSLMNFLELRCGKGSQEEIRRYAEAVDLLWRTEYPATAAAFDQAGRKAP